MTGTTWLPSGLICMNEWNGLFDFSQLRLDGDNLQCGLIQCNIKGGTGLVITCVCIPNYRNLQSINEVARPIYI